MGTVAWARGVRVLVTVTLAVVATTAFVACGGNDGPTLSRAAFVKKANAECSKLLEAGKELYSEADAKGQEVASNLHGAAAKLRDLVHSVDGLVPPDAIEGDVDHLVSLLGDYADGLDGLADRVEPEQSFTDVQLAHPKIVRHLNSIVDDVDRLTAKLALTGCITL